MAVVAGVEPANTGSKPAALPVTLYHYIKLDLKGLTLIPGPQMRSLQLIKICGI